MHDQISRVILECLLFTINRSWWIDIVRHEGEFYEELGTYSRFGRNMHRFSMLGTLLAYVPSLKV